MFARITRIDAEKNTANMIKYLFNYGFYKFGIEVMALFILGQGFVQI